jgi:hypothetical protein
MAKQNQKRRVENRFVIISSPQGHKDERGQLLLQRSRRSIERDGFRLVKRAVVIDEHNRKQTIFAGRIGDGRNCLLIGEKPL